MDALVLAGGAALAALALAPANKAPPAGSGADTGRAPSELERRGSGALAGWVSGALGGASVGATAGLLIGGVAGTAVGGPVGALAGPAVAVPFAIGASGVASSFGGLWGALSA